MEWEDSLVWEGSQECKEMMRRKKKDMKGKKVMKSMSTNTTKAAAMESRESPKDRIKQNPRSPH